MAGSVNKVILVGNIASDMQVKTMTSGDRVCNFSLATNESWKTKDGEKKEKAEFHRIVVFNQNLVKVCEDYLKKGAKIYIEGQLETRKWTDKDGADKYTTEVVLRAYRGEITMLDGKKDAGAASAAVSVSPQITPEEEDTIPF